jgi:predicted ATPase
VGQLLEPVVFEATDEERRRWFSGAASLAWPLFSPETLTHQSGQEELRFRRRHGLYWLIVNLSRDAPMLIAIDDAQWADEPSAGVVRHLATRLEQLSALLVIASRTRSGTLEGLVAEPGARSLTPKPLSRAAVGTWVGEALAQPADDQFLAAFHQATGGNPFMVTELLREVRAEGPEPRRHTIDRLRGVSPRAISTTVILRLASLSADAAAVARATAVLGRTDPSLIAQLAGLDLERAIRPLRN